MTLKNELDIHRTALALIQANTAEDEAAVIAVLNMVQESEIGEFLVALAEMVHYAHSCDPADGWTDFTDRYAAALDEAEAQI